MRFSVTVFPGSNCDHDCEYVVRNVMGQPVEMIWHKDTDLKNPDCVVVPGGFSYGDYLRTGAIARFSPVMKSVADFAAKGGLVIGICNGFQILCEAGLLPGALIRNKGLKFICKSVNIKVEQTDTPFTNACAPGQVLKIPIAHGEGNYFIDSEGLKKLKANRQIVVRYCDEKGNVTPESNPNGSLENIAGICNEKRNVFGLMPHPDRSGEDLLGSHDGKALWQSILAAKAGVVWLSSIMDVEITPKVVKEHGLKPEEYDKILEILGRKPNITELGLYSVMWSEHCGYKHSRALLKTLPTKGPKVLQGPGENAGIVDIGEGWAVAFKVESHNHPSAIEPYQGAATGVGGILRDIFTMGARPIASLNSLRFGPLTDPKVKCLFSGVVHGIADYGNCMGIPTVAGEVVFDESYSENCLVNAMSVGLVRHEQIIRGRATGINNPVIYIGATTGRDGIHGATFASTEITDESTEKRSAVQVADPFMEKLLMEATLELIHSDLLVGIQDMGAAGLTCSTCEMASRGGAGIEIDVAKVPQREKGMSPYEILLSESQERMLLVAKPGCEKKVHDILAKWDLHAATIGVVTDTGRMVVKENGKVVADVPADSLTEAPVYYPAKSEPSVLKKHREFDESTIPVLKEAGENLLKLLADPTIASKRWVYQQYDHMVRSNTLIRPGSDAAVIRVKGTKLGLAMTIDGIGSYCALDPYEGAKIVVSEAARNIACSGAEPIGMTDCLNFGSPEKPEVFYYLDRVIAGLGDACRAFNIPITGGNVSLYNENPTGAIDPTPIIGMMGLFSDVETRVTQWFKNDGDFVYLLGNIGDSIGGSRYLRVLHGKKTGKCPTLDLGSEQALHQALRALADGRLVQSAHDCSDGGFAVALAECCMTGATHEAPFRGAKVSLPGKGRVDGRLFGEAQSRAIVSCKPDQASQVEALVKKFGVPFEKIGQVGGDSLAIGDDLTIPVIKLADAFFTSIEKMMA